MITIYKTNGKQIEKCSEIQEAAWINLVDPTPEELKAVREQLNILPEYLQYPLDEEESSRVEKEEDQVLIIVRIPETLKEDGVIRFETIPLGIIVLNNVVVTVCLRDTELLDELEYSRNIERTLKDPVNLVFHIFLHIAYSYLKHLKQIDKLTDQYEEELHRSLRNQELIRLLNLEKSLVYFNTSLKSNDLVMARLESGRYLPISEENEDILEDALIENQQAIQMAQVYSDILSGTMDAYASVISNNLNIVMKFLTSVTIVLMLPNLVASIYGMNIPLPFQHSPHAFAITMGLSFVLSAIVVYIFFKKKLF